MLRIVHLADTSGGESNALSLHRKIECFRFKTLVHPEIETLKYDLRSIAYSIAAKSEARKRTARAIGVSKAIRDQTHARNFFHRHAKNLRHKMDSGA